MRITYDESADAVYIYLSDEKNTSLFTYFCDPQEIGGMINLDFNQEGKLIGIEVLGAKNKLPTDFIRNAKKLTSPILLSTLKTKK